MRMAWPDESVDRLHNQARGDVESRMQQAESRAFVSGAEFKSASHTMTQQARATREFVAVAKSSHFREVLRQDLVLTELREAVSRQAQLRADEAVAHELELSQIQGKLDAERQQTRAGLQEARRSGDAECGRIAEAAQTTSNELEDASRLCADEKAALQQQLSKRIEAVAGDLKKRQEMTRARHEENLELTKRRTTEMVSEARSGLQIAERIRLEAEGARLAAIKHAQDRLAGERTLLRSEVERLREQFERWQVTCEQSSVQLGQLWEMKTRMVHGDLDRATTATMQKIVDAVMVGKSPLVALPSCE